CQLGGYDVFLAARDSPCGFRNPVYGRRESGAHPRRLPRSTASAGARDATSYLARNRCSEATDAPTLGRFAAQLSSACCPSSVVARPGARLRRLERTAITWMTAA